MGTRELLGPARYPGEMGKEVASVSFLKKVPWEGVRLAFSLGLGVAFLVWDDMETMPTFLRWIGTGVGTAFFVGMAAAWGYGCATWARCRRLNRGDALYRAIAAPAILLLMGYLWNPAQGRRVTFWEIVVLAGVASIGAYLPMRTGRWLDGKAIYQKIDGEFGWYWVDKAGRIGPYESRQEAEADGSSQTQHLES